MAKALSQLPEEVPYRASILGAIATEAALRSGDAWLDAVRDQLDHNRRLLASLLAEFLPTVGYLAPEASFLAWLDCSRLGLGDDPADAFLARGRVALSHGPDFGVEGRGFARLNIGTSPIFIRMRRSEACLKRPQICDRKVACVLDLFARTLICCYAPACVRPSLCG